MTSDGPSHKKRKVKMKVVRTTASALGIYRAHWRLLLPIAAILFISDLIGWSTSWLCNSLGLPCSSRYFQRGEPAFEIVFSLCFSILHELLWITVLATAFAATSEAVTSSITDGKRSDIKTIAASTRQRFKQLVRTAIPVGLAFSIITIVTRLATYAVEPDFRNYHGGNPFGTTYYVVLLPTLVFGAITSLLIYTRCFLAANAVQHESVEGMTALRRSRELAVGSSWRIFGLLFITGVGLTIVGMLSILHFYIYARFFNLENGLPLTLPVSVLGSLLSALITSFLAVCAAVAYLQITNTAMSSVTQQEGTE